jgi:hypothetical protein
MADATNSAPRGPFSLLGKVESAEKAFLAGRRHRAADLESAVGFFLEFLPGFESFDFDGPASPCSAPRASSTAIPTTGSRETSARPWRRRATPS